MALNFVTKQRERKSKKTEKERMQARQQFGASENSKPHLRDVPSRKSLTYLVRILLETSYERSQGGKDWEEGGDFRRIYICKAVGDRSPVAFLFLTVSFSPVPTITPTTASPAPRKKTFIKPQFSIFKGTTEQREEAENKASRS